MNVILCAIVLVGWSRAYATEQLYLHTLANSGIYDTEGTEDDNAETFRRQLDIMQAEADRLSTPLVNAIERMHEMHSVDDLDKPDQIRTINNTLDDMRLPHSLLKYVDMFTAHVIDPAFVAKGAIDAIDDRFDAMGKLDVKKTHIYGVNTKELSDEIEKLIQLVKPANVDKTLSLLDRLLKVYRLECDFRIYENVAKTIFHYVLKGEMILNVGNEVVDEYNFYVRPRINEMKEKLTRYPVECTTNFRQHAEQSILYTLKPRGFTPVHTPTLTIEMVSQTIHTMLTNQFAWLDWTVIVYVPTHNHGQGYRGSHNPRLQPIHFYDFAPFHNFPFLDIVVAWSRKGDISRQFLESADVHCPKYFGTTGQINHAEMPNYDALHYAECAQRKYAESQLNLVHVYRCPCPLGDCDSCRYLKVKNMFSVTGCSLHQPTPTNTGSNSGCMIFEKEQTIILNNRQQQIKYINFFTVVLN